MSGHLNTIKDICDTYILSTSNFPVSTFNKVVETLVCKPSKENDEVQNQLEKELGITCNMIAHDFITWRKRELSKVNKL